MYKVVIASAGIGKRLENLSKNVNKALVTVNQKPGITYVVDKFDEDVEIVVPVGYKAQSVKDFLRIAYPKRKFTFIDIDLFEGKGSGLGYSLLKCKDVLQCPFIFIPNDSIVDDEIPVPDKNWMGYSESHTSLEYRSLKISNNEVKDILAKGSSGKVFPYIGLAGIFDYKDFWKHMESGKLKGAIEIGESYGLKNMLINTKINGVSFTWHDTGNLAALQKARDYLPKNDVDANILEKPDEAIWFCNKKVIKFHVDKSFISERVKRTKNLEKFVPKIIDVGENMYSYNLIEGEIFSKNVNSEKFKDFLKYMTNFWKLHKLNDDEKKDFKMNCSKFYKDKTFERIKYFLKRFEVVNKEVYVNDIKIPKYEDVLKKIDWNTIFDGYPVRFHGDLHFENILCVKNKKRPFYLLDWRQNFAGNLDIGDIYYDFAKLNHGLIISHEIINNNLFEVKVDANKISFDFNRKNNLYECQQVLKEYVEDNNFCWNKVNCLTNLIFLNIAGLHEYPYSILLYYLGLSNVWKDYK
tara:strand:+ start:2156 stop:3724 length:1569 start_codon:yes stop_codon:yes gene_type:complete